MTRDTRDFLDAVTDYGRQTVPANRIATIDASYTSGRPKVIFDGETVRGDKTYPYLASYTPVASHRVLLAPVGTGFVILGRIV